MAHEIHRVQHFEQVAPFTLVVRFEDGTERVIDFRPVFAGEIYGPVADREVFEQVRIDEEVHTLVWPTGADFDPAILYDWPTFGPRLAAFAKSWAEVAH